MTYFFPFTKKSEAISKEPPKNPPSTFISTCTLPSCLTWFMQFPSCFLNQSLTFTQVPIFLLIQGHSSRNSAPHSPYNISYSLLNIPFPLVYGNYNYYISDYYIISQILKQTSFFFFSCFCSLFSKTPQHTFLCVKLPSSKTFKGSLWPTGTSVRIVIAPIDWIPVTWQTLYRHHNFEILVVISPHICNYNITQIIFLNIFNCSSLQLILFVILFYCMH